MNWLTLILALPTGSATPRMRAWRALKTAGAAVLRDGVYLLPEGSGHRETLQRIASDVRGGGGQAWLVTTHTDTGTDFAGLFDRTPAWMQMTAGIAAAAELLQAGNLAEAARQARLLRKAFARLAGTDFFPGAGLKNSETALAELEGRISRAASPDEPRAEPRAIARLDIQAYRNRTWATRARPWVDRLASAWLIRRFIDPNARILWLSSPQDCPTDALGFDFDGATFSHVGASTHAAERVTFETLLAAFALETPALGRVAALVHFLDVGGIAPPETAGIERVLRGLRAAINDDDTLLAAAMTVFDGMHSDFLKDSNA